MVIFLSVIGHWSLVIGVAGCGVGAGGSFGFATGKVVDSLTLEPIAAALVILGGAEVETNAEGFFNIQRLPLPTPVVPMTITRDGYRTLDTPVDFRQGGELVLPLTPVEDPLRFGTIDGFVRDASSGEALAQVEVKVRIVSGDLVLDEQRAHSSNRGRFQVSGVPVGPAVVLAAMEGFLPERMEIEVTPSQGSNPLVELNLTPGTLRVTLSGSVFDVETRLPIEGAIVGTDESIQTALSDSQGHYELPEVLVGERIVRATASGYDPAFRTVFVTAQPDPVDLGLARATGEPPPAPFNLAGTVVVAGAADNSGVLVEAIPEGESLAVESVTTGPDGAFSFFLAPGRYAIRASLSGRDPVTALVELLLGEIEAGLELRL